MKNIDDLSKYASEHGLNWAVGYHHKDDRYVVSIWNSDRPAKAFIETGDIGEAVIRIIEKANR